jgi:hypothetical protein
MIVSSGCNLSKRHAGERVSYFPGRRFKCLVALSGSFSFCLQLLEGVRWSSLLAYRPLKGGRVGLKIGRDDFADPSEDSVRARESIPSRMSEDAESLSSRFGISRSAVEPLLAAKHVQQALFSECNGMTFSTLKPSKGMI